MNCYTIMVNLNIVNATTICNFLCNIITIFVISTTAYTYVSICKHVYQSNKYHAKCMKIYNHKNITQHMKLDTKSTITSLHFSYQASHSESLWSTNYYMYIIYTFKCFTSREVLHCNGQHCEMLPQFANFYAIFQQFL